ncbi:MAG: hypothetical protein RR248_00940 [Clostridia bacterium]
MNINNLTVKEVLSNSKAVQLINKYFPNLLSSPFIEYVNDYKISQLQDYVPEEYFPRWKELLVELGKVLL